MPFQPTAGDVHVNRPLTNFSQKWLQDDRAFVSLDAMPNAPVSKQSDLYYEWSRADFFRNQAKRRADGTESAGGTFRLSTSPYFCHVTAIHKDVTDRQRANQDNPAVDLDRSATQFVTQQNMIAREVEFQEAFLPAAAASGVWSNELVGVAGAPAGGQFRFWDNAASDPIVDIRLAAQTIHGATGKRPNRMTLGREAYDALIDNDAVLARITGGSTRELPAMVMRTLLAQLFELDSIHVMDSVVNTGGEEAGADINAGESTTFVARDNALLYHAPQGVSLDQPTAGQQFSWTGFLGAAENGNRIIRFRMNKLQADRVEGEMAFTYKVTAPELGFYFYNCVT